jgi:hypothetical protein
MKAQLNKKNPPLIESDECSYEPMFSETFVKALSEIFFDD